MLVSLKDLISEFKVVKLPPIHYWYEDEGFELSFRNDEWERLCDYHKVSFPFPKELGYTKPALLDLGRYLRYLVDEMLASEEVKNNVLASYKEV